METVYKLLLFTVFAYGTSTLHLPTYITPCKKSDSNLNACALENGKKAYNKVIEGDKRFNNLPLNPIKIPSIEVDTGENLKLSFTDFVCSGLNDVDLQKVNFDLEKKHSEMEMVVNNLNFVGKYDMNGKILVLPIHGKGDSNITFVSGLYKYTFDWNLLEKNGEEYAEIENPQLDFELKRAYFSIDNLFNGDKRLGDEMNKFLNDNWSEVMKDVGKGIGNTIEVIVTNVFKNYFGAIPFNEIFVD